MKPLPYRVVIKKARKAGFIFRRNIGGTHEIWWNEKRRKTWNVKKYYKTNGA